MARIPLLLLPLPLLLCACTGDTQKSAGDKHMQWQTAENLKNSGDLAGAARAFEDIAREDKTSVDAEIELAAIDRKMGRPADAVEVMKDALHRQPDNQTVTAQLAYALIDAGHPQEAVTIFDSLILKDPANALAYSGKGIAFDKAGNHLAAQDLYEQALKIAPGTLSIENNLAMSLILNNQLDHAITILTKLSDQNPTNKTIRHNLALAYGLKGDNEKALKLNLKDLPPEEAKENEKFYKYYSRMRSEFTTADTSSMQIGFTETPADEKDLPKPKVKHKSAAKKATPPVQEATPAPEEKTEEKADLKPAADTPVEEKPAADIPTMSEAPANLPPITGTALPTSDDSAANTDYPSQHRR